MLTILRHCPLAPMDILITSQLTPHVIKETDCICLISSIKTLCIKINAVVTYYCIMNCEYEYITRCETRNLNKAVLRVGNRCKLHF